MRHGKIVMAALIAVSACQGDGIRDDQPTGSIDSAAWSEARALPTGVREALDSGNAAFRAEDYETAREQYLRAVQLGPEESAGWFGLSMVERQLGNVAAADSAMRRVRQLAPGASLIEPVDENRDTSGAIHP